MARTVRKIPKWAMFVLSNGGADWIDVPALTRKPRTCFMGSAKAGRLDTWDDVGKGHGRAGKRHATKQIRAYHKAETKARENEGA